MAKYFLFDLDGTLSDSAPGVTKSVQYALEHFDIHVDDLNELMPFLGPPLKDSFKEFYGFDDEKAEKAVEIYRERYRPIGIYENSLFPGVKHMLKTLKRRGGKLAVASGKPQDMVETVLKTYGILDCFDAIVGSDEANGLTSKEAIMDKSLQLLFNGGEIDYDNTVMIGDRKFDVNGAHAHNLTSVAIVYDWSFLDELREAGADYIVFSAKELEELLLRDFEVKIFKSKMTEVSLVKPSIFNILYDVLLPIAVYYCGSSLLRIGGYSVAGASSNVVRALVFVIMGAVMYYFFGYSAMHEARYSYRFRNANDLRGADPIYRKNLNGVFTLLAFLIMGIAFAVACNSGAVLIDLVGKSASFEEIAKSQMSISIWGGILLYGFISPITEEIVFRGIIFNRLKRYYSLWISIVVSALLFGVYHGNIVQGTAGFLAGILGAFVYEKSGSLLWPVILHGIFNLVSFTLSNSLKVAVICFNPLAFGISAVLFGICLFLMLFFEKKNVKCN